MSVAVEQAGIDYHVVLAQNALQQCLDQPELQSEFICALVKQTSRHTQHRLGVQVKKAARLVSLGTARVVSPAYCLTKTTFNHPVPFLKLKRYSSIVRFFFFFYTRIDFICISYASLNFQYRSFDHISFNAENGTLGMLSQVLQISLLGADAE